MIQHEYYEYEKETGAQVKVWKANTLINEVCSDGKQRWTLRCIDGKENSNKIFFESDATEICHHFCWVDPDKKFTDKIKAGAEKEFEFFMKHGYHAKREDLK